MIISRTPLRVSFFGGGTDYPEWYKENQGAVISTSINKYSFISARYLPPFFEFKHRIRYYLQEEVNSLDEIKHPSVRECARFLGIDKGIEVVHNADLPARSGLGSSSAFTVGILNALSSLKNKMIAKRELALKAIHIEQDIIKENVGSQDQVAAAFGGLNLVRFSGNQEIEVDPIIMDKDRLNFLQDHLLLCFTGFARTASDVAEKQINMTTQRAKELHDMNALTNEAFNMLISENEPIENFGKLLNEQWKIKRLMSDQITNDRIDDIYEAGINGGAIGENCSEREAEDLCYFLLPQKHKKG